MAAPFRCPDPASHHLPHPPENVNPPNGRRMGVTTSPSLHELKSFAQTICVNVGLPVRLNRINRIATDFHRRHPNASAWVFFLYFANDVLRVTETTRQRLLKNPDVARVICYADPTGETAVNHVMNRARAGQ